MLQRTDVIGVVVHRLVAARVLLLHLFHEAGSLILRIVQLGEPVGHLAAGDIQLEAVGELGVGVVAPRKRRHLGRVIDDERGLDEQGFGGFLEQMQLQRTHARVPVLGPVYAAPLEHPDHAFARGEFGARNLGVESADRLGDRQARKRPGEVHDMLAIGDLQRPEHVLRHGAKQHLGEVHEVAVVAVSLVEFHHRELGIVARGNALVPEVAVDLEHALESAHHQALEVEFRRDAQVQLHVQRVVVRDEGAGRRAARDRMHHRRLDLEEPALDHEGADLADDAAAQMEHAARVLVHDQVDMALAVLALLVGEAMELLRQGPQRLGQQAQFGHVQRELAGPGLEQGSARPDDVAQVPALERRMRVGPGHVVGDVELDAPAHVLQRGEAGLAHDALEHHAPGHGGCDRGVPEVLAGLAAMRGVQVGREVGARKIVGEGVAA